MSIKILWKKFGGILFLFIFVLSIKILPKMDTAVNILPGVVTNFTRHAETYAKLESARVLDNDFFISLSKEIREGLRKPGVSRKEVLNAIASGRISPDVVEELEDAILGVWMEESMKEPGFVSEDEIMEVLGR